MEFKPLQGQRTVVATQDISTYKPTYLINVCVCEQIIKFSLKYIKGENMA